MQATDVNERGSSVLSSLVLLGGLSAFIILEAAPIGIDYTRRRRAPGTIVTKGIPWSWKSLAACRASSRLALVTFMIPSGSRGFACTINTTCTPQTFPAQEAKGRFRMT
jgi:hypothetical protein